MPTEVVSNKGESKINQVGRIWQWRHLSEMKTLRAPDVSLPDGGLYETEKMSLRDIGERLVLVVLLPNCDLVAGPSMTKGAIKKENSTEDPHVIRKEFQTDMVYLKYAVLNKTIMMSDLPRK